MMDPILPGLEKGSTNEELTKNMLLAALVMPNAIQHLGVIRTIVWIILSWLCMPLDMFMRVEHGERAISPLKVFNSFMALQIFWLVTSSITHLVSGLVRASRFSDMVSIEPEGIGIPPFFQAAFLIASVCHLWRISYRRRKNIPYESYSVGYSVIEAIGLLASVNILLGRITLLGRWKFPFRLDRWHIYLYIEPLIGGLIAYALRTLDPVTSIWLFIASGSLFIRNHLMEAQQRHVLLDYWDAKLHATYISEAAAQRPPTETAGIMVLPGFAEVLGQAEEIDIAARVNKTFSSE